MEQNKKLKIFNILFCLIGDWIVAIYTYFAFIKSQDKFGEILKTTLSLQGISTEAMDNALIEEMFQKVSVLIIVMIIFFLLFHLICYFLYYKNNGFGKFYVLCLAYVGIFGFALFGLTSLSNVLFSILLLAQAILYYFVIRNHKKIIAIKE